MRTYDITLTNAKAILQPRMSVLAGALGKALRDWNNSPSVYPVALDEFGRAVVLNQFWYTNASQEFRRQGDAGILLEPNGERYCFAVDSKLVLRFKHLDAQYCPRGNRTARSKAWEAQTWFPSTPPVVRLDFGYRLDITGTSVETAMVLFRNGNETVWCWQVWGYPVSEFASKPPIDMNGRRVYSRDDFSGAMLP